MSKKNLVGMVFGKLTVIRKTKIKNNNDKYFRTAYLCKCECGNTLKTTLSKLNKNKVKSCGCGRSHSDPAAPRLSSAKKVYSHHNYNDGDLLFDDFLKLSQQKCYYCGIKYSNSCNIFSIDGRRASDFSIKNGTFLYNGLDRKNNSLPHNKNNIVPCCFKCNWAKNKMNFNEFKSWIKKVYNFLNKNNCL